MKTAKALTLTYLTPVSFASLNGSDKEADNISSIKKISVGTEQLPYVSSQAVRRALRNQLEVLNTGCPKTPTIPPIFTSAHNISPEFFILVFNCISP